MLFAENNHESHDKLEIQQNGEIVQQNGEMVKFIKIYNDYILYFTSSDGIVTALIMTCHVVNGIGNNNLIRH